MTCGMGCREHGKDIEYETMASHSEWVFVVKYYNLDFRIRHHSLYRSDGKPPL